MSVRPALVECVVLSLQDACVFYPCCKGCFSRVQEEQQDTKRCRCHKCGYICLREEVDHRYRLSLRVTRDKCIFAVTVFGTSLNPFFGIHATGLHRLVENVDGPVGASTRSALLVKAVQDCFIGRHFIFGIKVTESEPEPWLRQPVSNGSSSRDTVQIIASQMILPKALGLEGCTVVSYYRTLLQKAAEYELGSTDPSKTSRPPETCLRLLPHYSPASSFNSDTVFASGLLCQSFRRSQHPDCTLTPTPPWQQSLGLVTSSAEQEEGCSIQESGDEYSRQTDKNKTPHHTPRDSLDNYEVIGERVLSPLALQCRSYNSPSFAKSPNSSDDKAVGNTPFQDKWFSPSPSGHNSFKKKELFTGQLSQTFISDSLAWEDFPFSESLTEFLGEENKDETEQNQNVQNQKETASNNLEVESQDKNLTIESTSVCQNYKQITDNNSQVCLGIIDTPEPNGADRHDLSEVCKNAAGCVNKSQARNIFSHECNQPDEKAFSASFENEDKPCEGDTYNCSADLFSGSLTIDMNTNTLNTHTETITEASPLLSMPKKQHTRREMFNVPHLTPHTQKLKGNKSIKGDNFIPPCTQELDFVPPSQSTPIVKLAAVTASSALSYRISTFGESPNELPRCGRESTKENLVWGTPPSRHRHRVTSKRRFLKHKKCLLPQQPLRVQSKDNNTWSPGRFNHKSDSSYWDVTVSDNEHNEVLFVPPTPATKTPRRSQTHGSSSSLGWTRDVPQEDRGNCKTTLLGQTPTSSQRRLVQTGHCDTETLDKGTLDGSNCDLETCDWSRDLFSDSL
uniref:DNA damage-induced apoptosis suppressor protein n=1 Tax=Semicossyphus pulcher TaxID=241346 RepID=UPI0037E89764